ncbi:MAG: FliM/FliN family flagellar motor switch protein [Pseudomonadota bacterium]
MSLYEVLKPELEDRCLVEWPNLPRLDRSVKALQAQLDANIYHADIRIGSTDCRLTAPIDCPDLNGCISAEIRFGEQRLTACLPEDAIDALLSAHDVRDAWKSYGAKTAAMVLEHLLAPVMTTLESHLDAPFRVARIIDQPLDAPSLALAVASTVATYHVGLSGDDALIAPLIRLMTPADQQDARLTSETLRFSMSLTGPSFQMPQYDLDALRPGDGVFVEGDWARLQHPLLIISGRLCASAKQQEEGFVLKSDLDRIQTPEIPMTEITDVLPVTITIELAQTTLPLTEIQDLRQGSVLPFADDLPTNVALTANGQPFGRGDLVRIDDKIAIRLTEIA